MIFFFQKKVGILSEPPWGEERAVGWDQILTFTKNRVGGLPYCVNTRFTFTKAKKAAKRWTNRILYQWNMEYCINPYDHSGEWFCINCWLPLTERSSGFIGATTLFQIRAKRQIDWNELKKDSPWFGVRHLVPHIASRLSLEQLRRRRGRGQGEELSLIHIWRCRRRG